MHKYDDTIDLFVSATNEMAEFDFEQTVAVQLRLHIRSKLMNILGAGWGSFTGTIDTSTVDDINRQQTLIQFCSSVVAQMTIDVPADLNDVHIDKVSTAMATLCANITQFMRKKVFSYDDIIQVLGEVQCTIPTLGDE